MPEFSKRTRINRSAEDVFAWHERPGAFERLSPPWTRVKILSAKGGIRDGAEVRLKQKFGPFSADWLVRHEGYEKGRAFSDRQISGPFTEWLHHHRFEPVGDNACDLVDTIEYDLPMNSVTDKVAGKCVRRELERVFRYRHEVTRMDLETHRLPETKRPLTIAITGATGLIGSALTGLLQTSGHEVRKISRGTSGEIRWDPDKGELDPGALEGIDGIVHLAGEPIAQRWTEAACQRIRDSRRKSTRLLAETAASLKSPPGVFVSMSGINAYGAIRSERLTEASDLGDGFLGEVCREWEQGTEPAQTAGIRTVVIRSGIVLSPAGGALGTMLPVFRMGLGGPIGSGQRWMSWIAIDDIAAVLAHAVIDGRYRGVFNGVAPGAVQNHEFTKRLGACLHRPTVAPVPPPILELTLGRMAKETLLSDLQVAPARLEEFGYPFRFPSLKEAFAHVLGCEEK